MLDFAVAEGHIQMYKESDCTSDITAHVFARVVMSDDGINQHARLCYFLMPFQFNSGRMEGYCFD